ncbi:MAG: hypothetical protein CMN75_14695 [Spirochaeta sp.]|nr:hypothetical protein [Spirochaeta sp.]RPG13327.1 MAG: hypothetical protein CBC32_002330 [Proteobacteria bacterium TMED72]
MKKAQKEKTQEDEVALTIRRQKLKLGWWALCVFLVLGLVLEALHGFKSELYLDVQNETRRLMWTLAHAHGGLIAILNILFGLAIPFMPGFEGPAREWASRCLTGALIALPAGFFLGGVFIHGGDPGLGIVLAPLGGALLIVGVFLTARGTLDS